MGILESVLDFAIVVAAGYLVIYYVVPKVQSGELGIPGITDTGQLPGVEGEPETEDDIIGNLSESLGDFFAPQGQEGQLYSAWNRVEVEPWA